MKIKVKMVDFCIIHDAMITFSVSEILLHFYPRKKFFYILTVVFHAIIVQVVILFDFFYKFDVNRCLKKLKMFLSL